MDALLDLARRACASSSRLVPSRPSVRNATRPASVRRKRSSRGSRPVASRDDPQDDAVASESTSLAGALLGQRLEMRLHACDLRHGAADRRLELLGDRVRLVERQRARQLHVQRQLGAARRRPPARGCAPRGCRGTATAAACARSRSDATSSGSTCTTTSAFGSAPRPPLDRVRRRVALAYRRAGRHADHDVGELAAAGLAHAEAPQLDRRPHLLDRRDGRRLRVGRGAVHQHVDVHLHQPGGCEQDEHGDEERRDRVGLRDARGARRASPTSTAIEPPKSLAKWSAFDARAALS